MMKMRAAAGIGIVLLSACSPASTGPEVAGSSEKIACATNGGRDWSQDCTVERISAEGREALVVHHPDGGFRRFDILPDGSLAQSDGSQEAVIVDAGTQIEVTLGTDRYRFDKARITSAR